MIGMNHQNQGGMSTGTDSLVTQMLLRKNLVIQCSKCVYYRWRRTAPETVHVGSMCRIRMKAKYPV